MESRDLPSGLAGAPHGSWNPVPGHEGALTLTRETPYHVASASDGPGTLSVHGTAGHALLAEKSGALPLNRNTWQSRLFKENAPFQFRAINSSTTQNAQLQLGSQQFSGFTLTARPFDLPPKEGRRPELLDFNFQSTTPLLQNGKFTFGPLGLPTNIPVLQKVKINGIYIYFTQDNARINHVKTFGPLFKLKADPLEPGKTDLFIQENAVVSGGFFVLNGNNGSGLTLVTSDFNNFKIPLTANGVHFGIDVSPL